MLSSRKVHYIRLIPAEPILGTPWNGILLPKLFRPTVRENCSSDGKKLLKFEAEGREFQKVLRSLEQFIRAVKSPTNFGFGYRMLV